MTREEAIAWFENWLLDYYDIDDIPQELTAELAGIALAALRQQETMTNRNGLNEPLTLDDLRKMDGEPVWWWNKSAKPVCTICVWDRFMDEPMFANYDWQSEDTLKLSKYKWLKKCGYKPYRQKPEEGTD